MRFLRSCHRARCPRQPVSPQVVALEGYNHQSIHTRGLRLHAVTSGSATDPLIVLLHDVFGGWGDFRRMLTPLADCGFHVAAIDIRGYGLSDKPPSGYDLRHVTGDIAGAIRTLGHDEAVVVGVEAGASIAWTLATLYPDHVSALVSVDGCYPTDLRHAALKRPWLFGSFLLDWAILRSHGPLSRMFWRRRNRSIAHELHKTTGAAYQASSTYAEDLELRQLAMSIESTGPAVLRTARYSMSVPPTRKKRSLRAIVHAPVLFITDESRRTSFLAAQARMRTDNRFISVAIGGTGLRPHMEKPVVFAQIIAEFVHSL